MQIHSRLSVHGHERSRAAGAVGLHGSRGCEGLQNASLQIEKETSRSGTLGNKNYRSLTEALPIEEIQLAIYRYSNIEPEVLVGKSRRGVLIPWRQMLYTLAYTLSGNSFAEIGRQLNRDHTTILHGIRQFIKLRKSNPIVNQTYKKLRYELSRM